MATKPKPKSQSQPPTEPSKNSTPPSRAQSVAGTSPETRTPRRKKKKKRSKSNTPKPETSNDISNTSSTALEHIPEIEPKHSTPSTSKIFHDDFIAFTLSEAEEEDAEEVKVKETPVREWDKRKARTRDSGAPSSGQKRKVDELVFNDGYSSKKQGMDAASRRAPWVWDVDMEACTNVAQMYVGMFPFTETTCSWSWIYIGFILRLMRSSSISHLLQWKTKYGGWLSRLFQPLSQQRFLMLKSSRLEVTKPSSIYLSGEWLQK